MQCLLLQQKSHSATAASCYPVFLGNCLNIVTGVSLLLVPGLAEQNKDAGWIWGFIFFVSGVN